jgi:hypothetical protein
LNASPGNPPFHSLPATPDLLQHLDSVVFRDVWKAVALAVNYALFNEVATEALFSAQVLRTGVLDKCFSGFQAGGM